MHALKLVMSSTYAKLPRWRICPCRIGPLKRPRQGNGAVEAGHKDLLRCAVALARRSANHTLFFCMPCWNNFA